MLEKPALDDARIIVCLCDTYGLPVTAIDFLPIGNDSSAWVYRVRADRGATYFLKVRKGAVNPPSVAIPRYLQDRGLDQVVAPIPTLARELWQRLDDFVLLLYPFIKGTNGMQLGLTADQWTAYGTILKRLHCTRLPPELLRQVRKETFIPPWSGVVRELGARIAAGAYADPFQGELAAFWKSKGAEIAQLVERAEDLGRLLQRKPQDFVLCHTDIHTANLLIDAQGDLFVVDWDSPLLAPRERDLMFVIGGTVGDFVIGDREEELFFRGYGATDVDWTALAYYHYEWAVQEIGDYGARVFLLRDVGAETKADAVQGFLQLFQPGDVVASAYAFETAQRAHAAHSPSPATASDLSAAIPRARSTI
jgi:spectinomycin phosphotransferase